MTFEPRGGPREIEDGAPKGPTDVEGLRHPTTNTDSITGSGRQAVYDVLAGNARRFVASRRMAPIPTCACTRCVRDPFVDRHRCGGEISDNMAEAAVAAVVLLDGLGTPALADERTCRAIWRIGRRDLAVAVHRRTAGAA